MEDKTFLYYFVFHKDYFLLNSYYKENERFGNVEIIFAQTHEQAKCEILKNNVNTMSSELYAKGILELCICECQLLECKRFFMKEES